MIVLKTNPEAARAIFDRLAARTEQFGADVVEEIAREGYDPAEIAWLVSQVMLSMSTAMHMAAGIPLETLLEQMRHNWQANAERMQLAATANGAAPHL